MLRAPSLWEGLLRARFAMSSQSDSVLGNLERHYFLSWLSLSLYKKGFYSHARSFFDGAIEIGEILQLYLAARDSDDSCEEVQTGLCYAILETDDCRFRISFFQSEDLILGDFDTLEECENTLRKMGLDRIASKGSSAALAHFSASKPGFEDIVERISGKSISEIAKEYKLLSDGYHQIVNEACLLRLKTG